MILKCENCFYYYDCGSDKVCNDYMPLGEEFENEYIEYIIENGRPKYYNEWFEYIELFND